MGEDRTRLRRLAEFAVNFQLDMVSGQVLRAARYCVLDSIGSALGAAGDGEISRLCQSVGEFGMGSRYEASVWGHRGKRNVKEAMLLNGMMGHTLELDDVHTGSKSHVGAVVVTAAWTCAEALGSTGREFLEAVIVGYEVMARIGMAMDVASNRKRGWHTTGIIGTFGAAAAAGRLLGLDVSQMVSALGIAGTQSCGLWAFLEDGATCKKLHPARAAVSGFEAAVLAKGSMTGPEHILDAKDGGLYRAVSDSFSMEALTKGLGETYEILNMDKKPYPCCRTTHPAIDAALAVRGQINPELAERILVETYSVGVLQCGRKEYPKNPEQAKFSIGYTAAAALVFGKVTRKEFSPQAMENPMVKRLAERTEVRECGEFSRRYPGRWGSRMTIFMKDGTEKAIQIDDMSGSVSCPLSEKQEKDKFYSLACEAFKRESQEALLDAILHVEELIRVPELLGEVEL